MTDSEQPVDKGPAKERRVIKTDKWPTISMLKGGQKICKPFNDGRGCTKAGCKDLCPGGAQVATRGALDMYMILHLSPFSAVSS